MSQREEMRNQPVENSNGGNDTDAEQQQQQQLSPPSATTTTTTTTLWESPPKLQQNPMTTYHNIAMASPPTATTDITLSPLRHRRNTSSSKSRRHGSSSSCAESGDLTAISDRFDGDEQQQEQHQPAIIEDAELDTSNNNNDNSNNFLLLQSFWRTYDTIIILSICSIIGIVFRMLGAKWFRRFEMGSVFSEDSALGTNLPLNVWSCFLMGLLCSGREAMGIVRSKVYGGANPYGTGRGIIDVGKGAYRGVIHAGRAGIHRARGRVGVHRTTSNDRWGKIKSSSSSSSVDMNNSSFRRRQRSSSAEVDDDGGGDISSSIEPPDTNEINNQCVNQHPGSEESTIAGLLGLDDEFRIVGSNNTNSEDEIRDVQLRALSRRILASPSLAFFPAKKVENDVMEHYEMEAPSSPKSVAPDDRFEIGDLDEIDEMASGQRCGLQNSSQSTEQQRKSTPSIDTIEEAVTERGHSISDHVTTIRRVRRLDGWDVDTSPEKMKHIILLGCRMGFCGALGTFASLNASVVRLLKAGLYGEALMGYAISIQLGIVSYRFGQHLAVYIFVWRCRRETKREERGGYGLRLQHMDIEEDLSSATVHPSTQEPPRRRRYISVRACATFVFFATFVSLILAIIFFPAHRPYLISLLFTPFGCLARWKLMNKYNKSLPGFPLGTFACNIGGCALSGSLASFIAGNPGADGNLVLTSMIAGFAGALSTFAAFIIEILSLIDPIIFKFDGVIYSIITILWAVIIGFVVSQAKNWADEM